METNPFSDILESELIITIMDRELKSDECVTHGFDDGRNAARQ